MNKFRGRECPDYKKVAGKIRAIVEKIRAGTPLEKADRLIRDRHYAAGRLRIERLSGEPLPMSQCYINLAIVERHGQEKSDAEEKDAVKSPFSIFARQKVETLDKTMQVELEAIFNERKGSDGQPMRPRRIFIRGRAGVGKTTLCKKIVFEFTKGTWHKWNELFDRVLWVPLRNLKLPERLSMAKYTFEDLFNHEFFWLEQEPNLASAMTRALDTRKTLFLLDGLDEVSQELTGDSGMARFLAELIGQPNVIITSRPSANPPPNIHLELETIGFGADQVDEYIKKSFLNPETGNLDQTKVDQVRSFLQERWLIQGLVRIPIQLDALCYTWDDLQPDVVLNTMSGMYKEIELKLWKKDILRLEKKHDNKLLTAECLRTAGRRKIELFVMKELVFIESLAFTGLYNDVINFTSQHLDAISEHFTPNLLPDKTLPLLSFVRTSDRSTNYHNQIYHFIHLRFQEYFAARYFVQKWKDQDGLLQPLALTNMEKDFNEVRPMEFLQKHKYAARLDIFWRFVAGLLNGSGQEQDFITAIEREPRDLLGPTHERLIMHCLSEISSYLPMRVALEQRLSQWLLFECEFNHTASLAIEVEFPAGALEKVVLDWPRHAQIPIMWSLSKRIFVPEAVVMAIVARLDDSDWYVRYAAVKALGR